MAAYDSTPLATALAVSLAIHVGTIAALNTAWGGTVSARKSQISSQSGTLQVRLTGLKADAKPSEPTPEDGARETPKTGLIELPGLNYFQSAELDRKPEPVAEVPLAYPAELPLVKRSSVVLSLLIDESGRVDKIIVETADAPAELAELASQAFAGTLFRPGFRNNQAVKSRLRVEVTFEGE
ncbi:MAG: energy transducer TonB [Rhodocyclaceae bacterium]|jgi:hypothetical protein|nr:hypothetical protein [Rhodocyclaceae bacterium]MBZ0147085.1 energy transducer TonB [Pseudorhodoplanes sp.]MCL4679952.1 energy transducer TonB [Rhodocyclaceae bacterium]